MANPRRLSDEQLLAQCRFEAFRGPGPGGQKKNKTSSAVRITHVPTGISVIAGESRSQHQNRATALIRLRHRLALEIREPLATRTSPIDLDISLRNPEYPTILGEVMDTLSQNQWSISDAAKDLKITTARLIRFLHKDEKLWTAVNDQRRKVGLKMLG
jgi:hypothetical protein